LNNEGNTKNGYSKLVLGAVLSFRRNRGGYFDKATFDDLLQEAAIAEMIAKKNYDKSRGAQYITYAWQRMYGAMTDHCRRLLDQPRPGQRRRIFVSDMTLRIKCKGHIDRTEQLIDAERIKTYFSDLTQNERTVMGDLLSNDEEMTPLEISKKLRVSTTRVFQIRTNALRKLRRLAKL
jgi:RNA polymerase sigma factor (sigma-70 family)